MVSHIVLWNFQEQLSVEDKISAGIKIKELLESLKSKVPGIIALQVVINEASSSNRDIALISQFESFEALERYQTHPEHVNAGKFVKSVTCNRSCLDFEG